MLTYKLHFIRHGLTQGNIDGKYIGITDMPVCEQGFREMESLKNLYEYPAVEAVYTSPLTRCLQTAEFFYPERQLTVVEDLREWDFGEFEGKTVHELRQIPAFTEWIDQSMMTAPPKGESGVEFGTRLQQAVSAIFADMMNEKITSAAVVTHGGVIMTLLSQFAIPRDPEQRWLTENGRGYTVLMSTQMWMRDGGFEVYDIIPADAAPMDTSIMESMV